MLVSLPPLGVLLCGMQVPVYIDRIVEKEVPVYVEKIVEKVITKEVPVQVSLPPSLAPAR